MSNEWTLAIPAEIIKEANASNSFLLSIPETAVRVGQPDDPKFRASWNESFQILSSVGKAWDKDSDWWIIEVQLQVTPDSPQPDNVARKTRTSFWLHKKALHDKTHEFYRRTMMGVGAANALLRALYGADALPHGESPDYGLYFGGDTPLVVGETVIGKVEHYKDKNGVERQDVRRFASAGTE